MYYNKVTLVGRICFNPTTQQTTNSVVHKTSIALNRKISGQYETTFIDLEGWGEKNFLTYITKGQTVLIEGEIKVNEYTTNTGEKKIKYIINVIKGVFLLSPNAPITDDEDIPF